jgi:hypothetical protein
VGAAIFGVPPLSDDLSIPHDDTPDEGIRVNPSPPPSPQLHGPLKGTAVTRGERSRHFTTTDWAALRQKVTLTLNVPWSSRSPGR